MTQTTTKPATVLTRYNALKHGMLRDTLTEYEKFDLDTFFNQLRDDYEPKSMLEEMALERIAIAHIKLRRVTKAEAEFIKETIDPNVKIGEIDLYHKRGYPIIMTSERMEKLANLYSRYETSAENRFYRAIKQFLEIKKMKYEQK